MTEAGSKDKLPKEFLIESTDMLANTTLAMMCCKAMYLVSASIAKFASCIGPGRPFLVLMMPRSESAPLNDQGFDDIDDRL